MDIAQEVERRALLRQNDMNAVIDRRDSPIQQFYNGSTVFVTGGSGFLGKQLIEKLFRSCDIKKVFVLLRPKKGRTIEERKQYILKDKVFDKVREKQPHFADKIVTIEGDVVDIQLGLNNENWKTVCNEVDTIYHGAATVRFDAPLRTATITNVRGTREIIKLARACQKIKNVVYVSTAFTHATLERIDKDVLEEFYKCPIPPEVMIGMAENMDEKILDDMTQSLIKGWPNTYTFTKAIAEELVRNATDLPICVVRPPIVISSYTEPNPGWLDFNSAVSGPSGIVLGIILGILHVFYVDPASSLPVSPVDYVNNCIIAAAWDAAEKRKYGDKSIPIYLVSNKNHYLTWGAVGKVLRSDIGYRSSTPKAVWYCFVYEIHNKFVFTVLSWILHFIPAYIADAVCAIVGKRPKGITSFVDTFVKINKFAEIFDYFLSNNWNFYDHNVKAMFDRMTEADKAIYNCDVRSIDLNEFSLMWGLGIRKYIIKDGLKDSAIGYARQMKFKILNYIVAVIYMYAFWCIGRMFWYVLKLSTLYLTNIIY